MLLGGGAYMCMTMSPRLSCARMARIGEEFWPTWIITGGAAASWARRNASRSLAPATFSEEIEAWMEMSLQADARALTEQALTSMIADYGKAATALIGE